jgi:hypothetical protein
MDSTPTIGRRFLTLGPLADNYIETRRVGRYPDDILFALFFQYIEHFLEEGNATHKGCFLTLIENLQEKSLRSREFYQSVQAATDAGLLSSAEFLLGLMEITQGVMNNLGLQIGSDYLVIEALAGLARALHCRGQVIFLIPGTFELRRKQVIGESGPMLVAIGASLEVYLLYDYLTKDSFFLPACNCLTPRYHIFAALQRVACGYAKTINELAALNVKCERCQVPYTKRDVERLLSDQDHLAFQTQLEKCKHSGDWGIVCMMCQFEICGICCLAQALTAKGPFCPKCGAPYDEQAFGSLSIHDYNWMEKYFRISMLNRHLEHNEKKKALELILTSGNTKTLSSAGSIEHTRNLSGATAQFSQASASIPAVRETGFEVRTCKGCGKEVKYSLCSVGCCCIFCAVSNIYSSTELQPKCLYCKEPMSAFLSQSSGCSVCKKVFRCAEMAYICLHCGYQVCELCFLRINGKIPSCGKAPHTLSIPAKVRFLKIKHARAGTYDL